MMKMMMRAAMMMMAGAVLVAAGGCMGQQKPKPTFSAVMFEQEADSDLTLAREQVFRVLLERHPPEKWAFLSYGQGESATFTSPTREVFVNLNDMNLKMAPVSLAHIPRLGEGGTVALAETGEPGILYTVKLRWIDIDTAEVEAARYEGASPLSGFGGTVKRLSGKLWRMDRYLPWVR
jgi:hypothetical protein